MRFRVRVEVRVKVRFRVRVKVRVRVRGRVRGRVRVRVRVMSSAPGESALKWTERGFYTDSGGFFPEQRYPQSGLLTVPTWTTLT